jgi:penicillin V acylase-like amidase (Ntn superfamily)
MTPIPPITRFSAKDIAALKGDIRPDEEFVRAVWLDKVAEDVDRLKAALMQVLREPRQ